MNYTTQPTATRNANLMETLKQGVQTSSIVKYGKQKIDLFTASIVLQVYNSLSPESQIKLLSYEVPSIINFCYKLAR